MTEAAPSLALDHLPFGVFDLEAARAALARLGFAITDTGVCRWRQHGRDHAARCASVVFERAYLDLIEIRDPWWEDALRGSKIHHLGMASTGVVLSAPSLGAARTRFAAAGFAVDEPYDIFREVPNAVPAEIHYRIFSLRGAGAPFAVIEDDAPRALRRPQWLRHANGASGVRCVHLRVSRVDPTFSRLIPEVVVHERPRDSYLADVSKLLPHPERAGVLAIEVAVADLAATRSHLFAHCVATREHREAVAIEPSTGLGCGLVFAES